MISLKLNISYEVTSKAFNNMLVVDKCEQNDVMKPVVSIVI